MTRSSRPTGTAKVARASRHGAEGHDCTVEAADRPDMWRRARAYADIEEVAAAVQPDTWRKATADEKDVPAAVSAAQSAAGAARRHMRSEDVAEGSRS